MELNHDELDFLDDISTEELLRKLGEVESGLFEFNLVRDGILRRLGQKSEA